MASSLWFRILLLLSYAILSHQIYQNTNVRILYRWTVPDFEYSSDQTRRSAMRKGQYIPNNVAILDADYHAPTKRYFVTTPQFRNGIPATLSEVVSGRYGETKYLRPFPNWVNNNRAMCQDPFSVYRIYIDKCDLMWVLDSGRADIFNTSKLACQPKLVVYDLNNKDREILNYAFPNNIFTDRSIFINLITESYQSDCRDSIVYIADVNDHGLVVFDLAKRTSWRIENKLFYPYPPEGTTTVNGVTFDLMDGIFGLALSPQSDRHRKLYFHSYASVRESWVPVSVLKNQTMAQDPVAGRNAFVLSEGKRAGQSTVQVMTDDGILIYAVVTSNAIACWNSKKPFTIDHQYILHKDNEDFQFISGMKLKGNKLLITSSRLQNYINGNVNATEYNYRVILIEDVRQLLKNTPCKSGSGLDYSDSDFLSGGSMEGYSNSGSYGGSLNGGSHGGSLNSGSHGSGSSSGLNGGSYWGSSNNGYNGGSYWGSSNNGYNGVNGNGLSGCRGRGCEKSNQSSEGPTYIQEFIVYKSKPNTSTKVLKDDDMNVAQTRFQDINGGANSSIVGNLTKVQNENDTSTTVATPNASSRNENQFEKQYLNNNLTTSRSGDKK